MPTGDWLTLDYSTRISHRKANLECKKAGHCCPAFLIPQTADLSGSHHFVGLQTLLALHNLEAHLLAFLQALEAITRDRAEMHEHVRAVVAADEAEALGIVEPLDGTDLTRTPPRMDKPIDCAAARSSKTHSESECKKAGHRCPAF